MRSKVASVSVLFALAGFSMLLSGCARVQTAGLSYEAHNHENILVNNIRVVNLRSRQVGDELVITGRLRRTCNFCYDEVPGHVDIAIIDPNGLVLATASSFYYPRSIPKSGTRYSTFSAKLKTTLPEDALIRTAYHDYLESSGSAAGPTTFQCKANRAVPQIEAETVVKAAE